MQILFGSYKGRRLKTPADGRIRPTTSRMRDWICNVMRDYFREARFLDLYAGCGTLGLHALSLGASQGLFVDNSNTALRLIHQNLGIVGAAECADVVRSSVSAFLAKRSYGLKVDLVFVDPPYDSTDYAVLMKQLDEADLLLPGGRMVIEHPTPVKLESARWSVWKEKTFGRSTITILSNE